MKALISFLGILLLTSNLLAQKAELSTIDKDAASLANELCVCTEELIKGYHPGIQLLLKDMMLLGQEVAQQNFEKYFTNSTTEEQEKIVLDVKKMEDFDNEYRVKCTEPMEAQMVKYADNTDFEEKLKSNLKNLKECAFTYQMMLLGEQQE